MFESLRQGNPVYLPSKYWEALNRKNLDQLATGGIENFKRTIALNYFTWIVGKKDEQFRYLLRHTRLLDWPSILKGIFQYDPAWRDKRKRYAEFAVFTLMLWNYAKRADAEGILKRIEEPEEGGPFPIRSGRKLISQDLANSVLEYYSMREHFRVPPDGKATICELGAGYGRNAYVFLHALPRCKYIIVDIPPALYVSQRYLAAVFRDRKIFGFRPFGDFKDVASEIDQADLIFLLPHQAEMLPGKSVDLFVNISSLHEMKPEQIGAYFELIDRLTRGYFYSKQWLVSRIPYDDITISRSDYPVPGSWRELYSRKARVQESFFEAMYAIGEPSAARPS